MLKFNLNLFRVVAHPLGFAFATVHQPKTVFWLGAGRCILAGLSLDESFNPSWDNP